MSPLEKLILKKRSEGKSMDPIEQKAKMGNLQHLHNEMSGLLKGELTPKAKVEVAADDAESLKEGLDKAKDVVETLPEMESGEDEMQMDDESDDSPTVLTPEEKALLEKLLLKAKGI